MEEPDNIKELRAAVAAAKKAEAAAKDALYTAEDATAEAKRKLREALDAPFIARAHELHHASFGGVEWPKHEVEMEWYRHGALWIERAKAEAKID